MNEPTLAEQIATIKYVLDPRNGYPTCSVKAGLDAAAATLRRVEDAERLFAATNGAGFASRPREPTQAMIMAAIDVDSAAGNYYSWVWRAMYDAYAPGAADGAERDGR